MNVKLLFYSDKMLILNAIRLCWKSGDKSDNFGEKDQKLIKRIIENGHTSTLEHSLYVFQVNNISRAILQEIARHRIGIGLSVESTRYTLKRILNDKNSWKNIIIDTKDDDLNNLTISHFKNLTNLIKEKKLPNDISKYGICENYPVNLQMSFNARSLNHFLKLRESKKAHFEIRQLANEYRKLIPEDHKIFFNM